MSAFKDVWGVFFRNMWVRASACVSACVSACGRKREEAERTGRARCESTIIIGCRSNKEAKISASESDRMGCSNRERESEWERVRKRRETETTADARRNFFGNVPQIPDFWAEPPIQLTGKTLQSLEKFSHLQRRNFFFAKKILGGDFCHRKKYLSNKSSPISENFSE